jgi:hypothetical protein
MHRSKQHFYPITSSARTRTDQGIGNPIASAALLLIISSSLAGNSTGRSPGLAPLRILFHISGRAMKVLRQVDPIAGQPARIDMIAEAIDRR